MWPIIFVRIASMLYYQGITDKDSPVNGGSYVKETGQVHECFNFAPAELEDGRKVCLGYAQLTGGSGTKDPELHIEKIVGCSALRKEEFVDDVIVVWCAKSPGSQNVRVVGFTNMPPCFGILNGWILQMDTSNATSLQRRQKTAYFFHIKFGTATPDGMCRPVLGTRPRLAWGGQAFGMQEAVMRIRPN